MYIAGKRHAFRVFYMPQNTRGAQSNRSAELCKRPGRAVRGGVNLDNTGAENISRIVASLVHVTLLV